MEQKSALESLIKKSKIILREISDYSGQLMGLQRYPVAMSYIITLSKRCLNELNTEGDREKSLRYYMDNYLNKLLKLLNALFIKVKGSETGFSFTVDNWQKKDPLTFLFSSYILLNKISQSLRAEVNLMFIQNYQVHDELVVDESSPLWDITDMYMLEAPSDITKVKALSQLLVNRIKRADDKVTTSIVVLQEQVSEIIKNAIRHGNKMDPMKKIKLWCDFNGKAFRLIVQDQGQGFRDLEKWNEFNRKRNEAIQKGDMSEMIKYIQYRTPESSQDDGGNALFAALEYWDSGLIYNSARNKVAVAKILAKEGIH